MKKSTKKLASKTVGFKANKDKLDKELNDEVQQFILHQGMDMFLDVCQGTINKLLIIKGLVTSDELRKAYLADIKCAAQRETKAARASSQQ